MPSTNSSSPAWGRVVWTTLFGLALACAPLAAHVTLRAPNGGETLMSDETAIIEWEVAVQHNTENWDLWYSVTGEDGPWIAIALDLPPGTITTGAVHTFDWVVPNDPSTQVRVRVQQDNVGVDYDDVSDDDLTIEASALIFADGFETGDTGLW